MIESDDQLPDLGDALERLAAGDPTARARVIECCAGRVRQLAHRMLSRFPRVRRWDDTDDVFQAAALRLHRALETVPVDSPRSVMALAATQIRRELVDLARKHSGPESYAANHGTNVIPGPAASSTVGRHVDGIPSREESLDRWTAFQESIEALPDEEREVFHLVWFVGATQKTIAALLGCSERTVKSRWAAARGRVKTALDGHGPE